MNLKTPSNKIDDLKVLSKDKVILLFERFKEKNPKPTTELIAPNNYTLLVSVVLSAQATDKSVNKATESLYKKVDTPEKMLELGEEGLIEYIKSIGLYRAKAKNVIALSKLLVENFASSLPRTREDLMSLPGVGRKTANVILNVVYGEKTMPVDTHLLRISPRIGLSFGTNPETIEQDLLKIIPDEYMEHAHHWLILHGRYICTARNPKCEDCPINDICQQNL
ncbi:MAG: endonuclease III [Spirochaetaceae bacterium]|nr:endonuclease III [Spirochaetaceae bacterium]